MNRSLAIGMLDTGHGETHVRSLLSELEIPAGSHKTLKMREGECEYAIEKVAKASCTRATASQSAEVKRERKEGVRGKITVSYDMRWAKRGKGEAEVDLDLLSGKTKFFPMLQEILDVRSAQLQNMEKR